MQEVPFGVDAPGFNVVKLLESKGEFTSHVLKPSLTRHFFVPNQRNVFHVRHGVRGFWPVGRRRQKVPRAPG